MKTEINPICAGCGYFVWGKCKIDERLQQKVEKGDLKACKSALVEGVRGVKTATNFIPAIAPIRSNSKF